MLKAIVTAGPTYEPLDEVRLLTNHSTGRLGIGLANYLTSRDVSVTLLKGYYSTHLGPCEASETIPFTTTDSLDQLFEKFSREPYDAIFHAAAVSDFQFGKISSPDSPAAQERQSSGKWPTRSGTLLAELIPTKKILPSLRTRFCDALLVGWKYEVEGDQASVIAKGKQQLTDCNSDLCVVNGPAYGNGFGIVSPSLPLQHVLSHDTLYQRLYESVASRQTGSA